MIQSSPRRADAEALSQRLRRETRVDHERVDAAFGRFDLADPADYAAFLSAQARVLPVAEQVLDPAALVPGWTARAALLRADLADLSLAPPATVTVKLPAEGPARWGGIYVLEGSRLGGAVLSRRVAPGLPTAFLGAVHAPGAWRDLLAALDRLAPEDHADAVHGAQAVFSAFCAAAA